MIAIISPAKSLDFDSPSILNPQGKPPFPKETMTLVRKLSKMSKKRIQELMSISENLATLNKQRYLEFSDKFTSNNSKPAILAFTGDVYLGMEAANFSVNELKKANEKIRILSGLYGIIKPLDAIQPYRLEMGTKLKIGKSSSLTNFWKKKITERLNSEANAQIIVNLASKEYWNSIDVNKLNSQVVTCNFLDMHNGQLKTISFNAKKARGMMCRFIIKNDITKVEELQAFDSGGYIYDPLKSTESSLTFIKE